MYPPPPPSRSHSAPLFHQQVSKSGRQAGQIKPHTLLTRQSLNLLSSSEMRCSTKRPLVLYNNRNRSPDFWICTTSAGTVHAREYAGIYLHGIRWDGMG